MRNTLLLNLLSGLTLLLGGLHTAQAQTAPCQNPTVPPPPVEINQLWAGADKTLYAVNEAITFRISSNQSGPCSYTIRGDRYLPILLEGTVDVVAGQESTVNFYIDYPCFLAFTVNQGGGDVTAGVAVDACDIEPTAYLPDDFDIYWDSLKTALAAVPLNPKITERPDLSNEAQTTYKMVLDNIDGKKVYGWISIPNCPGPFAAVMHLPSFGQAQVGPVNYEAADGIIGVAISIHDYDCEQWVPGDIAYSPKHHYFSRHTNYYKAAILGCIRAIDYIFTRPEFDGVHMAVTGVSQGGGLTLMTAGLDPRVKYIAQGVTALCNHAAFASDRSSGFPYWVREGSQQGGDVSKIIQETGYYDAVHFAQRYKGPSLNFVGYNDDVCPPASVFAAYNSMSGDKSMQHSITTGHLTPPNFWPDRAVFWQSKGITYSKYWAGCPPVPAADTIPPDSVQTFASTLSEKDRLTFNFKTTGDDLNVGTAYVYDIRYSTSPLDEGNFAAAKKAELNIHPLVAGEPQTYVLGGLAPGTTYYLGIKALDEADNIGPLAVAQGKTLQTSGTRESVLQAVRAYPNPVHSMLYVTNLDAAVEIQLLGIMGDVQWVRQVFSPEMTLDVEPLPAGMYLLQVRSKTGEQRGIRFVKQ